MGADLILNYIYIQRGREPEFFRARDYLKSLTDAEVVASYMTSEGMYDEDNEVAERVREEAGCAISAVQAGWDADRRDFCTICVENKFILISADMSYGDEPDGVRALRLFADMGLAEAAGFQV